MRTVAFVPVRLTSSRLPRKHLRTIGDRSLLSWVILRLKEVHHIDDIVICMPDESQSIELLPVCKDEEVECYIHSGDANDVVGRLTQAAKLYSADICVLASGDCPLLSPSSIDKLIAALIDQEAGEACFTARNEVQPIHEGIMVTTREVWELAESLSEESELREHLFPVIWKYPDKFSHFNIVSVEDEDIFYRLNHRISIDTPADLKFHRKLFSVLKESNRPYDLENVISVISSQPEYLNENIMVHQKLLSDKSFRVIIVGNSVSDFEGDANSDPLDLANKLIHEFGFGVEFFVFDNAAVEMLREHHLCGSVISNGLLARDSLDEQYDLIVLNRKRIDDIPDSFQEKIKNNSKKLIFLDEVPSNELLRSWLSEILL